MFSSPRRKKTASPGGTPGGIAFDAKSVLKHDVGKERKFRTKVRGATLVSYSLAVRVASRPFSWLSSVCVSSILCA